MALFSKPRASCAALLASATLCAIPVHAHVSFEASEARPNTTYKAILKVPHGCEGAPTVRLRVTIPEGIVAVKPAPKPGWTVETTKGRYARSYDYFGKPLAEGVKEIIWSGGSLLDEHYDEFVFQARLTDALPIGQRAYMPVVQDCTNGQNAWTEVPEPGQDAHALKHPAPGIMILAQAAGHAPTAAKPVKLGDLTIETPWTRATAPGAKVAGGYLRITNAGKTPDRLIGGTFPLAGIVEVHEMALDAGVMKMRALERGLEIAPGATVELKPGGYHMMFIELKDGIRQGGTVSGTLRFEKAGEVMVEYRVESIGARGPSGADHGH